METCLNEEGVKANSKIAAKIVKTVLKDNSKLPQIILSREKETEAYANASETILKELNVKSKYYSKKNLKTQKQKNLYQASQPSS